MKLTCNQQKLKQILNVGEKIIGRNVGTPILNNFLITCKDNKLEVISTNYELSIKSQIDASIEEEGSIAIPAVLVNGFINNLPNEELNLELKENKKLQIKCKEYKANISALDASGFPQYPIMEEDSFSIRINKNIIGEGLSQVVDSTSVSESRPELSGVFMKISANDIRFAATDGFRLTEKIIEVKSDKEASLIIPQKTIRELIKIMADKEEEKEIGITVSGKKILFSCGNTQIISRLIDGTYVNYSAIIPSSYQTEAIVNRKRLLNDIRIANLFTQNGNVKVRISPEDSIIQIISDESSAGENKSNIPSKIQGGEMNITLNGRYVLNGLENMYSDNVVLQFNSDASPSAIRPVGDKNHVYIVMPIKK